VIGSKPIDGGHYIFDLEERRTFLKAEPGAARFMRPFVGSEEYINGGQRWILVLGDASPADLKELARGEKANCRRQKDAPRKQERADEGTCGHPDPVSCDGNS
jgi:hypothetical protein